MISEERISSKWIQRMKETTTNRLASQMDRFIFGVNV